MKKALGYDAQPLGKAVKLTCSDGRSLVTDNYDDAIIFLLYPTEWGIVPNIDTFVTALTSIMPYQLSEEVRAGGEVRTPTGRILYYRNLRLFGINKERSFYGLQFASDAALDAVGARNLYPVVVNAFHKLGVGEVESLSSALGAFRPVLKKVPFSRRDDLPGEASPLCDYAKWIQGRDWREVYQIGYWRADEVYDYDQVSGYPAIVARLPDLSKARFFEADTVPDNPRVWGVLSGILRVDKPVSCFVWKGEDDNSVYAVGEWPDLITTDQYRLLKKYGIGDFKIERGCFLELPEVVTYPLQQVINRLYAMRDDTDPLVRKLAKAVLVSIAGGFHSQYEHKDGPEFNPIYACMTRSRCMVKTAAFIYQNQLESDLISVLVDGCLATKKVPVNNTKVMGSWRINEPSPALVLNVKYQWQGEQHEGGMYHQDVVRLIQEHPERSTFGGMDLNLIKYKRQFEGYPETGVDLLNKKYKSEPLRVEKGGKNV